MSSNSEIHDKLSHINRWLETKGWPTQIPDELKVLAYLGHLGERIDHLGKILKKERGGQSKEFSDDLRRADIFLAYRDLLVAKGHKNPSKKTVLQFCVDAAKILHDLGEITDEELSLWTKASLKSMQNTIKGGIKEVEEYSRKNNQN
jgi:hypothetical protein